MVSAITSVPQEVAEAIIPPSSYADIAGVVAPASVWLREHAPVALAEVDGYDLVWLISSHGGVRQMLRDATAFPKNDSNIMLQPRVADELLMSELGGTTKALDALSYFDPPVHTSVRPALQGAFAPRAVCQLRQRLESLAVHTADHLLDLGPQVDIVRDLATRFPMTAVLELIGVPKGGHEHVAALTRDLVGGDDPHDRRDDIPASPSAMTKQWHSTLNGAFAYFDELRRTKTRSLGEDLASSIVSARRRSGDPLPDRMQTHVMITVALGGHDTTSAALSGGLHGLATSPGVLAAVCGDPVASSRGLIEESLRWSTPSYHTMRSTASASTIGGVEVGPRQRLMNLFISANFDAHVFENPTVFDPTRGPNPHLSFSRGARLQRHVVGAIGDGRVVQRAPAAHRRRHARRCANHPRQQPGGRAQILTGPDQGAVTKSNWVDQSERETTVSTNVADVLAVQDLKHRYCWCYDARDLNGLVRLFTTHAVCSFGPFGMRQGIEAIRDGFRPWCEAGPPFASAHTVANPVIAVDGDHATGKWLLTVSHLGAAGEFPTSMIAVYDDEYRREGSDWLISRTKLTFLWSGDQGRISEQNPMAVPVSWREETARE